MADERRGWWSRADRAELERRAAEVDELAPFLEMAREIRLATTRIVADDSGDAAAITEVIESYPRAERERVAREVFARLPADVQWSVLERAFGDDEIRRYLGEERAERAAALERTAAARAVAHVARAERRLDTASVPSGMEVTLGLFREGDVRAALARGQTATTCARQLVLRSEGEGAYRVLEDVFSPRGGYFVTREYDEGSWRTERLVPHALVRVGSAGHGAGAELEPVVFPGGRADVEVDGAVRRGLLHVGSVVVDDIEVFAA